MFDGDGDGGIHSFGNRTWPQEPLILQKVLDVDALL